MTPVTGHTFFLDANIVDDPWELVVASDLDAWYLPIQNASPIPGPSIQLGNKKYSSPGNEELLRPLEKATSSGLGTYLTT